MENSPIIYICVILACLSSIASGVVIWAHIKIPQLHKHPGQMIVIICLIQMIFDLHWIAIMNPIRDKTVESGTCEYFGMVFNIMIFLSWNTLTCLVIELVIKVKRPLSTNYRLRNKIYIAGTILMTACEFSPMPYFGGFGLTEVDTCFVKDWTVTYWFSLIPIFLNVPFNMVCFVVLICSNGYSKNKALRKMVRACFSMCVCWGYPIFTSGMGTMFNKTYEVMIIIAFVLGSSAGLVIAIARLGSFEIIKRLIKGSNKQKTSDALLNKGINSVLIEDCSVNTFFQSLTDETVKDMVICFSMALVEKKVQNQEDFSYSYKKIKHNFIENDYYKLKDFINVSKLQLKDSAIWEYGKEYFDQIKQASGVEDFDLVDSFCIMANFSAYKNSNIGGRSGAFILITYDEKFVLKIINRKERYLLLDILPSYAKRVCECPKSKIVRVFGLFKMRKSKHSFIVMENIVCTKTDDPIFDLKGSIDDRYVDVNNLAEGKVLKDGNFLEMKKSICMDDCQRSEFFSVLNDDLKFFTKHNIIDYSLLVVFYDSTIISTSRYLIQGDDRSLYSLGIIDFLQEYSLEKKLELIYKRIKGKSNTSVCSSGRYSKRFFNFMFENLK